MVDSKPVLVDLAEGEGNLVSGSTTAEFHFSIDGWSNGILKLSSCGIGELEEKSLIAFLNETERTDEGFWKDAEVHLPSYGLVNFSFDVAFWGDGTRLNPNWVALYFTDQALPSIDLPKMRKCGAKKWMAKEKKGRKRLHVPFREMAFMTRCFYNALDERDQNVMKEIVVDIEAIINQGIEGETDADYWKKIAKIIKDSGSKQLQLQSETKSTESNNKPKPYGLNKIANTTYKNPGNCEVGDEGITFKEYAKWKRENTSSSSQTGGKKTHCYNPDTNTIKKTRYCPKGKSVTLEEGEALVKQGN